MSVKKVNKTTGATTKVAGLVNSEKVNTMYGAFPSDASASNKLVSDSKADEKISDAIADKADKVSSATNGNFAGLDASGNLTDSGKKPSDFQTALTFDNAPTENSNNPVKSGGVYTTNDKIYQVMGQNSAKNFIPFDLDRIKAKNTTGTWNGNVYSVNGIDFTFNSDGTVDASGTATETASVHYYDPVGLPPFGGDRILRLTGCPSGGSGTTYKVMAYRAGEVDGSTGTAEEYGNGISLRWLNNGSGIKAFISISVYTGAGTIDLTFKPMLRLSTDTDNTFAPYAKTNQQLTQENQTLTNQVKDMNNVYGAKNVLDLTARLKKGFPTSSAIVSFSNEGIVLNGTVSGSGNIRICPAEDDNSFVLPQGTYVLSHKDGPSPSGTGITLRKNGTALTNGNRLANPYEFEANGTDYFTVLFHEDATTFNNAVVCPMICLKSFYELDTSFEPYAKTNQQLTEDTTALPAMLNELGAKNLLPLTLKRIKEYNQSSNDTWSGNICTKNTGVTFKINTDDAGFVTSIVANANNPSGASFLNLTNSSNKVHLKAGNYKLNGGVSGGGENSYCWYITYPTSIYKWVTDSDLSVSLNADTDVEASVVIRAGQTLTNAVFKPMIRYGSINDGTYVPYAKTNRELTDNVNGLLAVDTVIEPSDLTPYLRSIKEGLTIQYFDVSKSGNVVSISATVTNSTENDIAANEPLFYFQEMPRITLYSVVQFITSNNFARINLRDSGRVDLRNAFPSGESFAFAFTYISKELHS